MSHPHAPRFPLHPELWGTDPTVAIDARVPNPNVPITPQQRLDNRYEIATGVDRLLRMHEQHAGAVHNAGPDGNMRRQFAAERGWAANMSGGGPRPDLDDLEFSRRFRQNRTVNNTAREVQRAGRGIEEVLADSDITDLVGYTADMLRVVTDNEREAYTRTTEAERVRRTATTNAHNRRVNWATRRADDKAHPHLDPTLRAAAVTRTAQIGHEAIVAHDTARVAGEAYTVAAGGEQTRRGFATLYNTIVIPIFNRYRDNMRRSAHMGTQVDIRLEAWEIGTEPGPGLGGIDSAVTRLQELRSDTIDDLPRRSTGRAEQLHDATIDRYRIAERHVLRPDQTANSYTDEAFTYDGGMRVNGGHRIVFGDGSQINWNGHAWEPRTWSNGTEWEAEFLPGTNTLPNTEFHQNRGFASDTEVEAYRQLSYEIWETVRSPEEEANALEADLDLTERYSMRINENVQAITELERTVVQHRNHATDLHAKIASIQALYVPGTSPSPEHQQDIDDANAQIIETNRQIVDLRAQQGPHRTVILHLRESTNRTEYWIGRHEVNRETTALGSRENIMHPDGTVERQDATINGHTGRWLIHLDGSTERLNPNGTVHSRYRPNGERI